MPPTPTSAEDSSGLGRVAVGVAAVVLVAAIAGAFFLFSNSSSGNDQGAADTLAKEHARSAQVAMEVYYTDEGSYSGAEIDDLQNIEPTLPDDIEVSAFTDSYTLTVPSGEGGNSFSIGYEDGRLSFPCEGAGEGGCPGSGEWE